MIEIPAVELLELSNLRLVKSELQASCPSLVLGQSWLPLPEAEFESGLVSVGIHQQSLLIFADLQDAWIHNRATEQNAEAYLHGDTFEIFLRNPDQSDYWEFHVTPQNVIFQACLPADLLTLRQAADRGGKAYSLTDYLVYERKFLSRTWIGDGVWNVLAEVPLSLLGLSAPDRSPPPLLAHFARYDYPKNRRSPILSSTATFSGLPDFHDQSGWSRLDISGRSAPALSSETPLADTCSI